MPGFERGRKLEKTGQHESDTAELFFNNVTVPGENLLGEVDSGFIYMMERLPRNGLAARSATSPTQSRPSSKPSNTPRSAKPSASRSDRSNT